VRSTPARKFTFAPNWLPRQSDEERGRPGYLFGGHVAAAFRAADALRSGTSDNDNGTARAEPSATAPIRFARLRGTHGYTGVP
jgi:hypothetical protein